MNKKSPCTPFLQIDATVLRANVERLAGYAAQHGINVRPHTKTHKSLAIADWQLDAGAIGLTAAKVGEAEIMAGAAAELLVAYPVVDPGACDRLARLAGERRVLVAVDSLAGAERLALAARKVGTRIGVLVDLDVGLGRTGVQSPEAALQLGQQVERLAGLGVEGIFCYPGHIWSSASEQGPELRAVADRLEAAFGLFDGSGLKRGTVSGGSTPTAYQSHLIPQVTEIRPGTYVFNDRNTLAGGYCTPDDCAAHLVCTVVSDAVPGQVVLDAGSKTLSSDRCVPAPDSGFGLILEYPEARITKLSEEHGQVDLSRCEQRPRVGERVHVLPNHICPCINLQDTVWWVETSGELHPEPVDARGRVF